MTKKQKAKRKVVQPPPSSSDSESIDPGVLASVLSADYPLVDPSLVSALLLDYDPNTLHKHVDAIREQLGLLEATAVPDTGHEEDFADTPPVDSSEWSAGRLSPPLRCSSGFSGPTSTALSVTSDDPPEPQSESELLATLFPKLSAKDIAKVLANGAGLNAAIDDLLSTELIQGVQSTGVWPDEPSTTEPSSDDERVWSTTRSRRGSAHSSPPKPDSIQLPPAKMALPPAAVTQALISSHSKSKRKKVKGTTIPIVDTLQRRPASPAPAPASTTKPGLAPSDVWAAFSSLAAYLAEVVPRAKASYYTSYLHSPDYTSAHDAVLAALQALSASAGNTQPPSDAVGILEDMYGVSIDECDETSALWICIGATNGEVASVMDLMDLLAELTWWPDYESAQLNDPFERLVSLSANVSAASSRPATPSARFATQPMSTSPFGSRPATPDLQPSTTRVLSGNRLSRPQAVHLAKQQHVVPGSRPAATAEALPTARETPGGAATRGASFVTMANRGRPANNSINWKTVAPKSHRRGRALHPLAASIPAYARGMLPHDQRPGALQSAERAAEFNLTPGECFANGQAAWDRRDEAIRAAGRHFKGSGRRDTGASVAGHYAARARAAAETAREWELRGARLVVDEQLSRTSNTVDLHYTTVEQAITLAKETSERWWSKIEADTVNGTAGAFRPLIVVTGKGRHSAGQKGVLGPAVAKALSSEGWRIEICEGYIAVKGRR